MLKNARQTIAVVAVIGGAVFFLNTCLFSGISCASSTFTVENSDEPAKSLSTPANTPTYNIFEKIREADQLLEKAHPIVGAKKYKYSEYRYDLVYPDRKYSKGTIFVEKQTATGETLKLVRTNKSITDWGRETALVIIDAETGVLYEKIVTQHGRDIIQGPGIQVSVAERPNGLTWNDFNTEFSVPYPYVVLRNKWPRDGGKSNYLVYTPYSRALADYFPELIEEGRTYTSWVVDNALDYLRARKIHSRFDNNTLVPDLPYLKHEYFEKLPVIEHTDIIEFSLDPDHAIRRVWAIIGANREKAFNLTKSSANALGWVQYTNGTWGNIRRNYKNDGLPDFTSGATNHLYSMAAAVLLHDFNLADIAKKYGDKAVKDKSLEEFLTAAYNASPERTVYPNLVRYLTGQVSDWTERLTNDENMGYIKKLRYLNKHYFSAPPPPELPSGDL